MDDAFETSTGAENRSAGHGGGSPDGVHLFPSGGYIHVIVPSVAKAAGVVFTGGVGVGEGDGGEAGSPALEVVVFCVFPPTDRRDSRSRASVVSLPPASSRSSSLSMRR